MNEDHILVLIVGVGPVSLSASLFLSQLDVPPLVVERHEGTAIHPRARGLNYRTIMLGYQHHSSAIFGRVLKQIMFLE